MGRLLHWIGSAVRTLWPEERRGSNRIDWVAERVAMAIDDGDDDDNAADILCF